MYPWMENDWINSGNYASYPDSDSEIFLKDSPPALRDGAFLHNLARVSGKNTEGIFMKILSLDKKVPHFQMRSPCRSGYVLQIDTGFALPEVCAL